MNIKNTTTVCLGLTFTIITIDFLNRSFFSTEYCSQEEPSLLLIKALMNQDPFEYNNNLSKIISRVNEYIAFSPFLFLLFYSPVLINTVSEFVDLDGMRTASTLSNTLTTFGLLFKKLIPIDLIKHSLFRDFLLRPNKVIDCFNYSSVKSIGFPSNHVLDFGSFLIISGIILKNAYIKDKFSKDNILHAAIFSVSLFTIYCRLAFQYHTLPQVISTLIFVHIINELSSFIRNTNLFNAILFNRVSAFILASTLFYFNYSRTNSISKSINFSSPSMMMFTGIFLDVVVTNLITFLSTKEKSEKSNINVNLIFFSVDEEKQPSNNSKLKLS